MLLLHTVGISHTSSHQLWFVWPPLENFPGRRFAPSLSVTCSRAAPALSWVFPAVQPEPPNCSSWLLLLVILSATRVWLPCFCCSPSSFCWLLLRWPYSSLFTILVPQPLLVLLVLHCPLLDSPQLLYSLLRTGGEQRVSVLDLWFQVWPHQYQEKADENKNFAWSAGYAPSSPVCGLPYNDFWLSHTWFKQFTITLRFSPARLLLSQLPLCTNAGVTLPSVQNLVFLLA